MSKPTVSVIGLGKLGSPTAACFAATGHRVIGVDSLLESVDKVNQGLSPVQEPRLPELFAAHRERLSATTDVEAAVLQSDVTLVIVPTPSDEQGAFKLDFALAAMESVGAALRRKDGYHLVVLSSTVLPGSMKAKVAPVLEARSGKVCGRDFGLCYNPMFIALGSVVNDLLNPDVVLIGESDPEAGARLAALYEGVCENRPPMQRMNWFNAELSKVAVNAFVTMKISFANTLAEICERVPEADVAAVTAALGQDRRIGARYLTGGLGFGGPCFPRDNAAFSYMAKQLGVDPLLSRATDLINERQKHRLETTVASLLPAGGTVGILGVAYKPGTAVTEQSQGLHLAQALMGRGVAVVLHDPLAMETGRRALQGAGAWAASASECIAQSDLVVLANPCPEYKGLEAELMGGRPKVVVDCWRLLDPRRLDGAVRYVELGAGRATMSVCQPS